MKATRAKYSTALKDSTNFYNAINKIKHDYKDSIDACPYNYVLNKTYGAYYFSVLQDDNRALASQKKVLQDQLKCLDSLSQEIAITYFNIGQSLDFLGQAKEAEQYYFKVINIENRLPKPHSYSSNHFTEIGTFYNFQGDNSKAIFYFEKAEASHIGAKNSYYRNLLRSQAIVLEKEGSHTEAIIKLKEALKITSTLTNDALVKEARICDDISRQYKFLGDFAAAENYSEQALKIAKTIPDIKPQDLNNFLNHYSHIKKEQGEYKEAIQILLRVRKSYFDNLSSTELNRISGNYENMGDIYFLQGKYQDALENYQEGMQLLDNNLTDNYLRHPNIKNRQFIGESYLLRQMGLKSKALYALALEKNENFLFISTLEAVEKYDTLNRRLFKENWDETSYLPVLKESRQFYQLGLNAAMHLYKEENKRKYLERAYSIVAKLKSQLLDRSISIEELKSQEFSDDILEAERRIKDSILLKSKIYQTTLNANDSIRKNAFNEFSKYKIDLTLYQKKTGIDKIVESCENMHVPSIIEIQNHLKEGEALLEFHLESNQLYYFLITKDNIALNSASLSKTDIISYYDKLSQGARTHNLMPSLLLDQLKKIKAETIIIIPDQELLQIPFESLPLDSATLWIDKFEISYEYSSAFLFDSKPFTENGKIAAFASDYSEQRFKQYNSENSHKAFSPLQHTLAEVGSAQEIIGGKTFTNQNATKSNFLESLNEFSIFHFALHGTLDKDFPDNSGLIFEAEDNFHSLSASEIYNLEIPAKLVVLSACNSGVGPVEIGDGVRSLTRSFIHSGSGSVITSLWQSSDASTKDILDNFYMYLKNGMRKSEALRKAKLQYIQNASPTFKKPKYWAHLILVGDSTPLFKSKNLLGYLSITGFVLFILVLMIYKKTRKV